MQWLCNANKKSDIPARRLYCFFSSLYSALVRGARAVLQLYPENSEQLELITTQATRAGFTGGVVVDFPNSAKAKKFYLCLFSGPSTSLPKGLTESQEADQASESAFTSERAPHKKARRDLVKKSREWVLEKKERRRRQGKEVRPDTQYTGRKRKPASEGATSDQPESLATHTHPVCRCRRSCHPLCSEWALSNPGPASGIFWIELFTSAASNIVF